MGARTCAHRGLGERGQAILQLQVSGAPWAAPSPCKGPGAQDWVPPAAPLQDRALLGSLQCSEPLRTPRGWGAGGLQLPPTSYCKHRYKHYN